MSAQCVVQVTETSQVGEARRAAVKMAAEAGFGEVDQGRIGIVATELGTNLLRHAGQGQLFLQQIKTSSDSVIELLSVDRGRGIENVEKSLRDGYSTAGTAGNGLGAVQRLSNEFDIYSQLDQGTVVLSRCRPVQENYAKAIPLNWGGLFAPALYETVCGDCWRLFDQDGWCSVMVADGLGHGPLASEASEKAADVFDSDPKAAPQLFLRDANRALAGTRGAAIAMAQVRSDESVLKFAGVGNISGTLFSEGKSRGLCSHNGTVGVQLLKIQEFEYPLQPQDLLVMFSDGLLSRWSFENYPGLATRHPAIIAGVLMRDFRRGRDDVTVVVVRFNQKKAQRE